VGNIGCDFMRTLPLSGRNSKTNVRKDHLSEMQHFVQVNWLSEHFVQTAILVASYWTLMVTVLEVCPSTVSTTLTLPLPISVRGS